jgi:hypothetical protein
MMMLWPFPAGAGTRGYVVHERAVVPVFGRVQALGSLWCIRVPKIVP